MAFSIDLLEEVAIFTHPPFSFLPFKLIIKVFSLIVFLFILSINVSLQIILKSDLLVINSVRLLYLIAVLQSGHSFVVCLSIFIIQSLQTECPQLYKIIGILLS